MREYEKIGVKKANDGRYRLRYALSSKQKKILKVLGISEKDYKEFARQQNEILNQE